MIRPTSVISAEAKIHSSAKVGPDVVIADKVAIEEGVVITPTW